MKTFFKKETNSKNIDFHDGIGIAVWGFIALAWLAFDVDVTSTVFYGFIFVITSFITATAAKLFKFKALKKRATENPEKVGTLYWEKETFKRNVTICMRYAHNVVHLVIIGYMIYLM